VATRLPYLVGEGDIYSRIMGQQAAPAAMGNYYEGFTGGYDPGLYRRRRDASAAAGAGSGSGLLDTGGGGAGDVDSSGGQSGNPADAIALGNALSAYGGLLGGLVPGGFLAGLLGKGLTSSGITALGEMEANQAALEAASRSMESVAAEADAKAALDAASRSMEAVAADNAAAAAAAAQAAAAGDLAGINAADIAAANAAVGDLAGITAADVAAANAAIGDLAGITGADVAAADTTAGDLAGITGADIAAADAAASAGDLGGMLGSTDITADASSGDFGGTSSSDFGGGDGGGGGGGKIICTKLHDLGLMPREIYEADQAFGALLVAQSPETYAGYVIWAKHIVKWMEREDWFGAFVRRAAYAIATPWSVAMAQEMGLPVKSSWAGRALLKNGLRVCQFIGKMNQVRGVQNV
jgi:hypothetical protein